MNNVVLRHQKSKMSRQLKHFPSILSGVYFLLIWIFVIRSFTARSDLITSGQIYLYQGKDILFQLENGVLITDKEGIAEYTSLAEKGILPAQYFSTFIDSGGEIIMKESLSNSNYLKELTDMGAETVGTYEIDKNRITIEYGANASTYIHELGHYIDGQYGFLSSTARFHDLADTYRGKYVIYKKLTNDSCTAAYCENFLYDEMFAEMFTDSHVNPFTMKCLFPEIYEYMVTFESI